jgi:hypothetical protein
VGRRHDDRAALGARARDRDLAVGVDPRVEVADRLHALAQAADRREQEAEQRWCQAGRKPVDSWIEVADDVAPVVTHEVTQLVLLVGLRHREQPAR